MEEQEIEKIPDERLLLLVRTLNFVAFQTNNNLNQIIGSLLEQLHYILLEMYNQKQTMGTLQQMMAIIVDMYRTIADMLELTSEGMTEGKEVNVEGVNNLKKLYIEQLEKFKEQFNVK